MTGGSVKWTIMDQGLLPHFVIHTQKNVDTHTDIKFNGDSQAWAKLRKVYQKTTCLMSLLFGPQ